MVQMLFIRPEAYRRHRSSYLWIFFAISGIPHGIHLSPLVSRLAFADHLKLYCRIKGLIDASFLQHQLTTFASWCKMNCSTLNINKCTVITFTRSRLHVITNYKLDRRPIARVDQIKDLGVVLDSMLSYSLHTSYVVDKASKNLGFIFRMTKHFKNFQCLKS